MMARLERWERRESKPLLCVCESAIVCVHRVCTCVGVCTMPVLRVCVGGSYVRARVYTSCRDGTWRPRIAVYTYQVCSVCVHGLCAVFPVRVIACSISNRMSCVSVTLFPFSLCFSFFCGSDSLSICVHGLHVPVTYV